MELGIEGKHILVSGASQGIGLAIAEAFAAEGASVALAARNGPQLEQVKAKLSGKGSHVCLVGDMTREEDIIRVLDETNRAFGGLDALILNVGGNAATFGSPAEISHWHRVSELNFAGSAVTASVAAEFLKKSGGNIIFITSIAGMEDLGAPAAYMAAKASLQAFVKSLSRELGPHGVRVNAVAPGNVLFSGSVWDRRLNDDADQVKSMLETEVPLQRFGRPEEIADTVLFLASDRAQFVTGATWVIDGGQSRHIG